MARFVFRFVGTTVAARVRRHGCLRQDHEKYSLLMKFESVPLLCVRFGVTFPAL
jgi:hypothetical protein